MNDIDWSQYEMKSGPDEGTSVSSREEQQEDFSSYETKAEAPALARHGLRTGARVTETVLGFPGDFLRLLGKGTSYAGEKLTGKPRKEIEKGLSETAAFKLLPSSDDIRSVFSTITGGLTEPKGEWENLGDEVTSLATALAIPSKAPQQFGSFLSSLGKTVAKSTGAIGAGKVAESLGGGEKGKLGTELGVLYLTSVLSPKTANHYVDNLYKQATAAVPEKAMAQSTKMGSDLSKYRDELKKGVSTPTKDKVLGAVDELINKTSSGAVPVSDLTETWRNLNEIRNSAGLYDIIDKGTRKLLRSRINGLQNIVSDAIEDYGSHNKAFHENWRKANEGFRTIAESKRASQWLSRKLPGAVSHLALGSGLAAVQGHPVAALSTVAGAGAGYGALQAGQLAYRYAKSPTLRKHYNALLRASLEENLPAAARASEMIEKELSKD